MNLNVLKDFPYSKKYYLTHPWKFFKEIGLNTKAAWDRATKGYCATDKWNLGYWLIEILPKMLDDLADTNCGYPGTSEFPTPESWDKYLRGLAANLRLCTEEAANEMNEYEKEFMEICSRMRLEKKNSEGELISVKWEETENDKEISKKYFDRCKEISEEQDAIAAETFTSIGEHIGHLWD